MIQEAQIAQLLQNLDAAAVTAAKDGHFVHASLHAGALLALRALWTELHPPETEAPSPPPQE